ncbi:cytochrome P450 [Streptomyces sp. NPDC051662]|uniref:cytochrome P450 n=1 Tax=Streptomyces sp. NPDC051662 TaxID=3154750 RepID=UPI00342D9012
MTGFVFDPLDDDYLENPYPVLSELRQRHPVHWHEGMQSWIVSRYDDCLEILRNADVFCADPRRIGQELPRPRVSIQTLDGTEHARIRNIIVSALQRIDPSLTHDHTGDLLKQLIGGHGGIDNLDFVQDIAVPVTTRATLSLFGLGPAAEDRVADASTAIVRSMMHGLIPEGKAAGLREREIVTSVLDAWYGKSDEGLLGIIHGMPEATSIDREALLNSLRVVLLAGINSTQRLLALSMRTLLSHEGGLQYFVATPSKYQALNELVRYEGSAQSAARFCSKPTSLHGQQLRKGDSVIALLGSANRDERRFQDADTLILDRRPNPHLGFGRGAHACLGISLAQSIGCGVLEMLGTDYPKARLTGPAVVERNPALRGLNSLPVSLT